MFNINEYLFICLQTDWNDGRALCAIVRNLGGPAPPYEKLHTDPSAWEHNLQMGMSIILLSYRYNML